MSDWMLSNCAPCPDCGETVTGDDAIRTGIAVHSHLGWSAQEALFVFVLNGCGNPDFNFSNFPICKKYLTVEITDLGTFTGVGLARPTPDDIDSTRTETRNRYFNFSTSDTVFRKPGILTGIFFPFTQGVPIESETQNCTKISDTEWYETYTAVFRYVDPTGFEQVATVDVSRRIKLLNEYTHLQLNQDVKRLIDSIDMDTVDFGAAKSAYYSDTSGTISIYEGSLASIPHGAFDTEGAVFPFAQAGYTVDLDGNAVATKSDVRVTSPAGYKFQPQAECGPFGELGDCQAIATIEGIMSFRPITALESAGNLLGILIMIREPGCPPA